MNKILIAIAVFLVIISCDSNEESPVVTIQNGPPGVYVGGFDTKGNGVLWKDGTTTTLSDFSARPAYIFIDGDNTYLAGRVVKSNTYSLVYWKNSVSYTIKDDYNYGVDSQLSGFTVSGNDLHAVWLEYTDKGRGVIKYWKNGQVSSITDSDHSAKIAGISVYGNDVYICGSQGTTGPPVAMYWKNGKGIPLTDGKTYAMASSIFVYRGDVYVAGTVSTSSDITQSTTVARYWKNGVAVDLTNGTREASASSIYVDESGVYVCGRELSSNGIFIAKYWKNGTATSLTDGTVPSLTTQILVSNNDVYVVGRDSGFGTIWKNGVKFSPFDTDNPEITPSCISVLK